MREGAPAREGEQARSPGSRRRRRRARNGEPACAELSSKEKRAYLKRIKEPMCFKDIEEFCNSTPEWGEEEVRQFWLKTLLVGTNAVLYNDPKHADNKRGARPAHAEPGGANRGTPLPVQSPGERTGARLQLSTVVRNYSSSTVQP